MNPLGVDMADKLDITPSPEQYKTMLLYVIHHSAIADDVAWAKAEYKRCFE